MNIVANRTEFEFGFDCYQSLVEDTRVYPPEHDIVYPSLGLCGEAGEVAEKVKKFVRGDKELDDEEVIKELGDVLWYVTALAIDLGYDLATVAEMNMKKLSKRKENGTIKGEGDNR